MPWPKATYFSSQFVVHYPGKSGQEPKAGTDSKSVEEYFLLACSSWLAQPTFLYTQGPCAQGWHQPRCSSISITKKGGILSYCGSPFAGNCSSVKLTKTTTGAVGMLNSLCSQRCSPEATALAHGCHPYVGHVQFTPAYTFVHPTNPPSPMHREALTVRAGIIPTASRAHTSSRAQTPLALDLQGL